MTEGSNPYRAPEVSIVADAGREGARRLPVHTAISLFCWVVGGFHCLGAIGLYSIFALRVGRAGWSKAWLYATWPSPRPLMMLVLIPLCTAAYFAAGRLLWARKGRPGLILCGVAIGMSYLYAWLLTWK